MNEPVERLLSGFKPKRYELYLQPNREQLTFAGKVTIEGTLVVATTMIKLHAKGLRIDEASFSIGGGVHQFVGTKYGDNDTLYLIAPSKLNGEITLTLAFFGEITQPMVGMYISNFEDEGIAKQIVATQFESHHAREVFPCIDEPAAKATFDLTLQTPVGETVLANTPAVSHHEADGWLTTVFEATPIMSTYLLAFAFGPMVARDGISRGGTEVRIWSTPQHQNHTKFALDTAIKSLDALENFFGMPFPLPKIDHVALPDFAAGAMENWGLITYREAAIVVDPAHTTLEDKQAVATTIAHELSHQWFGNLVTMEWWTDLWLNEGFASWLEVYIVDQLYPEWRVWDQFISDSYLAAQSLDALANSHPIEVTIDDPNDIRSIFDAISYDKGACVIRMLHQHLGHERFSAGLNSYLQTHAYANASTADLWKVLEETSKQPVREFMTAWTSQAGFPMLSANISENQIDLSQRRFLLNPKAKDSNYTWPLPIDSTHTDDTILIKTAQQSWSVADAVQSKLNRGQASFYITSYDEGHDARLNNRIKKADLEPIDRLGLLSDRFGLAKAGVKSTVSALNLLNMFDEEADAVVWDVMAAQVGALRSVFASEDLRQNMKPFLLNLVKSQLARLGWNEIETEDHFDKLLRPTILALSASAEEPTVMAEINRRFDELKELRDIPADIRGIVFSGRARHGNAVDYDKLQVLYVATHSAQAKLQIAAALCAFKQPELIKRSLDFTTSRDVRLQETLYWVSYLFHNSYSREAAWAWLKDSWPWIVEKFGSDIMTFSTFPKLAGRAFSTSAMAKDYQEFFTNAYKEGIDRPIAQGLETIHWQSAWKERDAPAVMNYFKNWRPTASHISSGTKSVTTKSSPLTSSADNS